MKRIAWVTRIAVAGLVVGVSVYVWRAEAWRILIPFPRDVDRSRLKMTLSRTSCFGSCPAYKVSVAGDGTVKYDGRYQVLIEGTHTAQIPAGSVTALLDDFRNAGFLAAKSEYSFRGYDMPAFVLTLQYDGREKQVVDYWGESVGMPKAITKLENQFDSISGTGRWVSGDARTVSELDGENWDFSALTKKNVALYDRAVQYDHDGILNRFLESGFNPFAEMEDIHAPACMASSRGNVDLVRRMVERQGEANPSVASECLGDAVAAGNLTLVNYWLAHGGNARSTRAERGLLFTVTSGSRPGADGAAIVAALVAGGADPHEVSEGGSTPLFHSLGERGVTEALIAAGVDLNAKTNMGSTALMEGGYDEEFVRTMLAAGADPTPISSVGETALSRAEESKCGPCVGMLEDAIRKRHTAAK